MSNTTKAVIGVVVVLVLVGGAYYLTTHVASGTLAGTANSASAVAATGTMPKASTALPGGSSDSNGAIQQDTAAIDVQMNDLNTDNANVQNTSNP